MKFGNYNINTVVHDTKPSKFDSLFRLDKLKLSTPNFLTRFHNRIETFRRLNSRCESPISYRASLFDSSAAAPAAAAAAAAATRHVSVGNATKQLHPSYHHRHAQRHPAVLVPKFHANDFPNKPATANNSDNFYVFGDQIRKIGIAPSQRAITGRNYLVQPDRRKISAWPPAMSKPANTGAAAAAAAVAAKRSRIRRQNSTLKDILNTTTLLDEDVEFKVLKDYFETTSYSEIVRDPDFKDYLNRKNYGDILDYMNDDDNEIAPSEDTPSTLPSRSMSAKANKPPSVGVGLSKSRSTGHLYESLSLYDNYDRPDAYLLRSGANANGMPSTFATMPTASHRLCNSLKRIRRAFRSTPLVLARPPPTPPPAHHHHQHHRPQQQHHQHCTDQRRTRCGRRTLPPPVCCADKYQDIKRFCQLMFDENHAFDERLQRTGGAASLGRRCSYSDKNYKKLLQRFVRTKGFGTVDAYVYAKFGQLLDQTVGYNLLVAAEGTAAAPTTRWPADCSKRYMANIPKRYHVTKQQFLEADFTRNVFGSSASVAATHACDGADGNVYSEPYARVRTMPNMRAHRRHMAQAAEGQRRPTGSATGAATGAYRTWDQRVPRNHDGDGIGLPPTMCSTLPPPQRLNFKYGDQCFQRRYQRAENGGGGGGWPQRRAPLHHLSKRRQPQHPMHDTLPPDWPRQLREQRLAEDEVEKEHGWRTKPLSSARSFPSMWCGARGSDECHGNKKVIEVYSTQRI